MSFLFMLIVGALVLISIAFFTLICSITIWSGLKGAPFTRSKNDRIAAMLAFADIREGTRTLELGSGDGVLAIRAAQKGARAHGVEINPFLVWYSRWKIRRAGLTDRVRVTRADALAFPFNEDRPDAVLLYLMPDMLENLKNKLFTELRPKTRIISNAFAFKGIPPSAVANDVYFYEV